LVKKTKNLVFKTQFYSPGLDTSTGADRRQGR